MRAVPLLTLLWCQGFIFGALGQAQASPYEFSILVKGADRRMNGGDRVGPYRLQGFNRLSMNDQGDIAFWMGNDLGVRGIFTPKRVIALDGDDIMGVQVQSPFVTNQGEVVYTRTGNRGSFEIVTANKTFTFQWRRPAVSVNLQGDVFYVANNAITKHDGKVVISHGQKIGDMTVLSISGAVAANDKGQVVFEAGYAKDNGEKGAGLLTLDRLVVKLGSTIQNRYIARFNQIYLCDTGEVIFDGPSSNIYDHAIFNENRLLVKLGDTIDGKTLENIVGFSANQIGEIAFLGLFNQSDRGVFTLGRLVAQKGTMIGDKTIKSISHTPVINGRGDIAFVAALSDDSEAIILARPTTGQGVPVSNRGQSASSKGRYWIALVLGLCLLLTFLLMRFRRT